MNTEHFDKAASTWDLTDRRQILARDVVAAIQAQVTLSKEHSILDFGCGTGLVALALAPWVGSIAGADTSIGMLKVLEEKAQALGIPVRLLHLDAERSEGLGGPYDLIVSSMTLHHVQDVAELLRRFATHLQPGGQVALADLDVEDGSFHEKGAHFHHRGFSRLQLHAWLEDAGFESTCVETATLVQKDGKDYSVFLATAKRK